MEAVREQSEGRWRRRTKCPLEAKRKRQIQGPTNPLHRLTPAHDAEFEQVARDVGAKDLDHQSVEVVALEAHPREAGEQGEVQEDGAGAAGGLGACQGHGLTEQEAHVQQEDSQQQVHVHLDGVIPRLPPAQVRVAGTDGQVRSLWWPVREGREVGGVPAPPLPPPGSLPRLHIYTCTCTGTHTLPILLLWLQPGCFAPTKCPAPIGLGTMRVFNSSLSQTQQGRPIRHCTQQGAPQARRKKTGFSFLALENPCSPPVFCVCLSVSTTVTLRTQTAWPVPSRLQVCVGTSLPIPAQDSRWFSALSVLAP